MNRGTEEQRNRITEEQRNRESGVNGRTDERRYKQYATYH